MITIFSNSTGYTCMQDKQNVLQGGSYVEKLHKEKGAEGIWLNGYTMWHARIMIPTLMRERARDNWFIIHVGACESITTNAVNFLYMMCYWLNYLKPDHYFMSYIAPKMLEASDSIVRGEDKYFRYFTPEEFRILTEQTLKMLEGFSVILMGISRPNPEMGEHRYHQAHEFEVVLEVVSGYFNNVLFCNVWNLCADKVEDTNHLNKEGHDLLYDFVCSTIGV